MANVGEGQYYYARHRGLWGVWKKGKMVDGIQEDDFISDFCTKIQAETFVYKMNGWRLKK